MVIAKDTPGVAGEVHAEQDCLHVVLPRFSFVFARVHHAEQDCLHAVLPRCFAMVC